MMGIMTPEICRDRSLIINIGLVASCWFSIFTLKPEIFYIKFYWYYLNLVRNRKLSVVPGPGRGTARPEDVLSYSHPLSQQILTYLLTYLLTYSMAQSPSWEANWSAASQEIPRISPRRFITALTSVRHLSLFWASPIQSLYTHPTSGRSILILSAHLRLGLPSGLLPSG